MTEQTDTRKDYERTYNNVPINIFDEFGEICIEINAKASKEKLSNIRLVLK